MNENNKRRMRQILIALTIIEIVPIALFIWKACMRH